MKKKTLVLLAAFTLVFSMTACGDTADSSDENITTTTTATTEVMSDSENVAATGLTIDEISDSMKSTGDTTFESTDGLFSGELTYEETDGELKAKVVYTNTSDSTIEFKSDFSCRLRDADGKELTVHTGAEALYVEVKPGETIEYSSFDKLPSNDGEYITIWLYPRVKGHADQAYKLNYKYTK